jgi:hypothetical protein
VDPITETATPVIGGSVAPVYGFQGRDSIFFSSGGTIT